MEAIAPQTSQMTVEGVPVWVLIPILAIVGVFALRHVSASRQLRHSLLVPIGVVVLVICGLRFGNLQPRHSRSVEPASEGRVSEDRIDVLESVPALSGRIRIDGPADEVSLAHADARGLQIQETEHGKMLVLPLSASLLEAYLGPEGADALQRLSSAVPPELRQAYALIPIPGAVGDAVPGLHALATTIAHLTEVTSADADAKQLVGERHDTGTPLVEAPAVDRPQWLKHPGDGQIVVWSDFEESRELTQASLASRVTQALLDDAVSSTAETSCSFTTDQLRFRMTEQAVEASIQDRFVEEVPLTLGNGPTTLFLEDLPVTVGNGPTTMFHTAALVQFPDEVRTKAIRHVKRSVQNQRAWTVGATAVSLGLFILLAAGLLRLTASSSRVLRWSGVPLVALLMLPGFAISGRLIQRVVVHENAEIPSPFELPDTIIGVGSDQDTDRQPMPPGA